MSARVQVVVNGEPVGDAVNLRNGDSLLFTMPWHLLSGRARIAEWKIARVREALKAKHAEVVLLEETIREMAAAASLNEAVSIAFASGVLSEND